MASLTIPGFNIGISNLTSIFDKSFLVWKTITQAQDFGEDMADWMCKLQMEFFRFQAWWTALEHLQTPNVAAANSRPVTPIAGQPQTSEYLSSSASPLVVKLRSNLEHPITNAAASVLKLLEDIEAILRTNGVLAIAVQPEEPAPSEPGGALLIARVDASRERRASFARELLRKTPLVKRLTHDTRPWKTPDKIVLEKKLDDFIYWNQSLYSILPRNFRNSVLSQGIPGRVLEDVAEAERLSRVDEGPQGRNTPLRDTANLRAVRQRFEDGTHINPDDDLEEKLRALKLRVESFPRLPTSVGQTFPYSIVAYAPLGNEGEAYQVLIEWYPFPLHIDDVDLHDLARRRISQLSYLLLPSQKPSTLHTFDSIGFLEHDPLNHFGLVFTFPPATSASLQPVTLFDLVTRTPSSHAMDTASARRFPYPTLEQRYNLAAVLASSLYTFMLARWHHKRFLSSNIAFLFSESTTTPDLSHPFVGGFALSRLNAEGEVSINGPTREEMDVYLHPELRVPSPQALPRFIRAYDIYSFGIVLVEIGFWNSLSSISPRRGKSREVEPGAFRDVIVKECRGRLGCWMGKRYRDVTLRCLNVGIEAEGGVGLREDLDKFYWDVVLELIKCVPSDE